MRVDMANWKRLVVDQVRSIADEEQQKTSWFGKGNLIDSPDEQFCAFFDDASVPEFLKRSDNGLDNQAHSQLSLLTDMMRKLSDAMTGSIQPDDLVDDPRWLAIRKQAQFALAALSADG